MFKKHMKRALAFPACGTFDVQRRAVCVRGDGSADTQKFMSFNLRHDLTSIH